MRIKKDNLEKMVVITFLIVVVDRGCLILSSLMIGALGRCILQAFKIVNLKIETEDVLLVLLPKRETFEIVKLITVFE